MAIAVAVPNVLFCLVVLVHTAAVLGVSGRAYVAACVQPLAMSLVPLTIWLTAGEAAPDWGPIFFNGFLGLIPYMVAVAAGEWSRKELPDRQNSSRREKRDPNEQRGPSVVRRRRRISLGR